MSLVSLNSSNVQVDNPPLYQSIKELIDQVDGLQKLVKSFGLSVNGNELDASISSPLSLLGGQIKFPAVQNASLDVNTLDDYEELPWTPIDSSGAGLIFTYPISAQYIKIGQLVLITGGVLYPVTANAAQIQIGGLPFTNQATQYAAPVFYTSLGFLPMGFVNISGKEITYFNPASGAGITNVVMSGKDIRFSAAYRAIS